jgi:hypothetical protein
LLAGEPFDLCRDELRRRLVLGGLVGVGLVEQRDWTLEDIPVADRPAELRGLRATLERSVLARIYDKGKVVGSVDMAVMVRSVSEIVGLLHETAVMGYAREVALTGLLPTMTAPMMPGIERVSWREIDLKYAVQQDPEGVVVRASVRRNEAVVRIKRARKTNAVVPEAEAQLEQARQEILRARKRIAYAKKRRPDSGPERRLPEPIAVGTPMSDVVEAQLRAQVEVLLPTILPPHRPRGRPRKHLVADADRDVVEKDGGGTASP